MDIDLCANFYLWRATVRAINQKIINHNGFFNYKYLILFLFFQFINLTFSAEIISTGMPFKIGMEFQENKALCKWALDNNTFQRKTIFYVENQKSRRKLWKLVIDTSDIEFVTEPFTNQEATSLGECIDSILLCLEHLKLLLTHQDTTTFQEWASSIMLPLEKSGISFNNDKLYEFVKDKALTKPKKWIPSFSPQVTIQHPLEYTIPLAFMLLGFNSPEYMFPFCASLPARDMLLTSYNNSNSQLFGQIVKGYCTQKMSGLLFLHALTIYQMTSTNHKVDAELIEETLEMLENYHQIDPKMRLALMSRRPFSSMFKDINKRKNIDYDRYLLDFILRGNSSFAEDFPLFPLINYAEQYFDDKTGEIKSLNSLYSHFKPEFLLEIQLDFKKIEDFIRQKDGRDKQVDEEKRRIIELIRNSFRQPYDGQYLLKDILPYLKKDFLSQIEDNIESHFKTREALQEALANATNNIIIKLLSQGIISTAMLRNFKDDSVVLVGDKIMPINTLSVEYSRSVISTVTAPGKRYDLQVQPDNISIVSVDSNVDGLSPPWFLDKENSMGALKDNEEIDLSFGEAIIEFRCIRNVQHYFLEKLRLSNYNKDVSVGSFLAKPDVSLKEEALKLFEYLNGFGTEQQLADFHLGMTKAVPKY